MNESVTPTPRSKNWFRLAVVSIALASTPLLTTFCPPVSQLEQVLQRGVLRVSTINSPTTYYEGPTGPTGFAYDLIHAFADELGVEVELTVDPTPAAALDELAEHNVDISAAGIMATPDRRGQFQFGPPVLTVRNQLVYQRGSREPKSLADVDGTLVVGAGSAAEEFLQRAKAQFPNLKWTTTTDAESEELLRQVADGEIDYTVASSDLIAINQRYRPEIAVAFDVGEPQDVAWAFPGGKDASLLHAAESFLSAYGSAELERLRDRHFGHVERVDYVGAVAMAAHVESRLPRYLDAFKAAAQKYDIDWRLLAAIGYQESHWSPEAISETGVRGLMQLTQQTADYLNVANRDDPHESIAGGARYFRYMLDRLPPEIKEPDRTWMALAAYNMGLGHLLDARRLAEMKGGDPNRWVDVRNELPLLTQSRWYSKVKYGYARGYQAMHYVGNIRTYYDMLQWMFRPQTPDPQAAPAEAAPAADKPPPQKEEDPLPIHSPVL